MAHCSNEEAQTSLPDLLLRSLEELTEDDLNKIKFHLIHPAYEKYQPIPRGQLENLNRSDIADMMIRSYGEDGALNVMLGILKKMNQNDLVQRLGNILQKYTIMSERPKPSGAQGRKRRRGEEEKREKDRDTIMSERPKPSGAQGRKRRRGEEEKREKDRDTIMSERPKPSGAQGRKRRREEEEKQEKDRGELMLQYQQEIKCNLKQKYECVFEGKAKEGQPTLLSEIYTELYITEGGTGGVNDEHEVRQIETASRKRRTEDTTVKCNDIFKPLCGRKTPIRTVLTKGVAGIGKTVSVQKFILDWAEGKANQDIHFIFALPFRNLNLIKDEYSLTELLHRFVTELKSLESTELFKYKVLFIFDGLDECRLPLDFQNCEGWCDVKKKMSLDVLLINLIKGDLLPSALLWITSRPAATNQIPPDCIHRVTEIRGFSDAQKEEYFRRRFSDQSLASRIITHVKSSRSLFIMCHIPVFCWISATVLERLFSETDRAEIPRTLTQMYTHFLIFQTSLKKDKYMKNYETKLKEYSKEFLLKLGKLAFVNLEKGNLIFYEQDLTENDIDVSEASVHSGVCTEVFKEEYGLYQDKVYCFVHLSIQEYLAALYVFLSNSSADLLETAVDQALKSKNGHLDLYLRFLLGLSTDSSKTLLQRLLGETRICSHAIKEMDQYIHPSNVCPPMSSGPLGSEAFPQTSMLMAGNNPGWGANLSQPQYIHPSNVCTSVSYSGPLGSEAFPQSSVPMAGNNPGWGASPSQPQYIHPSNVCRPVSSGPLGSVAFPQSSVPIAGNNPGWGANPSQPQYIHPSNVCPPMSSGPLGSEAFPQSSVPMAGTDSGCDSDSEWGSDSELDATPSLAEYIKDKIEDNLSPERTINLFHCLIELGDNSLVEEVQRYLNSGNLSAEDLSPAQYSALAFVMLMSDEELDVFDLKKYIRSDNEHCRLLPVVKNSRTALLNSCDLSDENCEVLASALRSNSSPLRKLDLSDNDLQDSGVKLLSAALRDSHCKLEILRLAGCSVKEGGCSSLDSALRSNPSPLRELDLSNNDLQDSGVKLLSAGLGDSHCKLEILRSVLLGIPHCKLEILRLSGCRVTEEGCSSLASALRSNPSHLRELDLSYNHPGDSGVKLLSAVLEDPSCKLEKLNVDHSGECRTRPGLQKYSCQLTLDPNTAHRSLSLSEGNRKVTMGAEWQPYPDHPERFEDCAQVLCRESLTGRCYWEAEWDGGAAHIGVTYKGIGRKGEDDCQLGFNDKSWCLYCDSVSYSVLHNHKWTVIPIKPSGSHRVGVYLDWGAGALSFYRVSSDGLTPLYRFTSSFTELLCPGFWVLFSSVSL
ncbi:uncharacterized protein [Paramormyrops kingsleyae]|uniref:uncharacterized protein isoform X3 n=1 Tax=Paramormyrops kingsleyae TaxID=1676925 RepID=UPI003B96A12C